MAAPTGKGSTPMRSLRIADDPWVPAGKVAAGNGETLTDVVVRALREYAAKGVVKPLNHSASGTDRKPASLTPKITFGGRKVGELRYTAVGGGRGYQVWRGAKNIGRVMRQGSKWWAYTVSGKGAGSADSMSDAGARLNEGADKD